MQGHFPSSKMTLAILRWIARIWATAMAIFWGMFFVEHLSWFFQPEGFPPAWVFGEQALHFLLLFGLLAIWRWPIAGGLIAAIAGLSFFLSILGLNAWFFLLITIPPALLAVGVSVWEHRADPKADAQPV